MTRLARLRGWLLGVLVVAGLAVAVWGLSTLANPAALAERAPGGADQAAEEPGRAEPIEGRNVSRVTLTADAAKRIGLKTAPVLDQPPLHAVPFSAVLYDPAGDPWVFTNPAPLVFVRERVTVETVQGDVALLSAGPAAGTQVVTVGVAELYGTEVGVGEE
jgi:hypothetical protein